MVLKSWFAGKTLLFTCLPLPSLVGAVCSSLGGVVSPSLVSVVCGGTTCSLSGLCLAFHSRFSGCFKGLGVGEGGGGGRELGKYRKMRRTEEDG